MNNTLQRELEICAAAVHLAKPEERDAHLANAAEMRDKVIQLGELKMKFNWLSFTNTPVAPRAPTDAWNLWHPAHINLFFDRLIENFVVRS